MSRNPWLFGVRSWTRTGYVIPAWWHGVWLGRRRRRRRRHPRRGRWGGQKHKKSRCLKNMCEHMEMHIYNGGKWAILKGGCSKNQVLRIGFPIVEHVRTSSEIVLHTSRGLQLPYRETEKTEKKHIICYWNIFFQYLSRYIWPSLLSAYAGLYAFSSLMLDVDHLSCPC